MAKATAKTGAAVKKGNKAEVMVSNAPSPCSLDELRRLHRWMLTTRLTEEKLVTLLASEPQRFGGTFHPATGQEAVAAGSIIHLQAEDWVTPSPRELGAHLCRGMSLQDVFAHAAHAQQSPMQGRDGGGHLGSMAAHTTPALGSTASNLAVGAGIALSFQLRRLPQVVVGFFGDAIMGTGTWHEVINLVAAHGLPMVLVCNNNGWGFSQPTSAHAPVEVLASRGEAYGIPGVRADGTNVEDVFTVMRDAVARARAGKGGTLVECVTPRLGGFTTDEPMLETVDPDGVDALVRLEARLLELQGATTRELAAVHTAVAAEVDAAAQHARALPVVDGAALTRGVYA